MGKYTGVIFDLDGVICFTDKYHYQAWKAVADKLGIYFDETINNRLRGVSRMDSLEIILERYDGKLTAQEKEALAEEKNALYRRLLANMSPAVLSAEVKETLDALRGMGLKLAIGSSSKNTKFILSRLGLGDYFDAISDGTNITRSKPDPQVFLMAADFIGMKPEKCLVVEDAKAGIQAAVAGGFDSAGLGEAAFQVLARERMVERLLRLRAGGLADIAAVILHGQLGRAARLQNRIEVYGHELRLAVFIGRAGCGEEVLRILALLPGAEHVRPGLAEVIALGEALAREHALELLHVLLRHALAAERRAVGLRDHRDILRPLHAAFDFNGGHAHALQVAQIFNETVVLQAQRIAVLVEPAIAVGQTAGLRALAAVA